ncbi:MAG: type II toxin-antitoxin system HicB family antitoxin [Chloroflexi bacterium]|nr:type II toxin-antitoxin system HicB family antitoxin [Chloroflexota bacterium]
MRQYHYTILLHPDKTQGGYWVTVPALPGCYSQGDTLEEAIAKAREAIHLYIATLISEGEPIPEEDDGAQAITIDVEAPAA